MSSSTITVNPRRRTARSPPPSLKTDDTATSKGTIILRNPLPKYSFQPKLDKKETVKSGKETDTKTNKVESKIESDNKAKDSQTDTCTKSSQSKLVNLNQSDTNEGGSKFHPDRKSESFSQEKERQEKQSESDSNLHIGVLVNSFPQDSVQDFVNQTAEVQVAANQDKNIKIPCNDIEPEVVKSMIEKLKPVNIVDPISCTSGTRLSHSYSESAISVAPSGFLTHREPNLSAGQGLTTLPSVSNSSIQITSVQEQTGSQLGTNVQSVTEVESATEISNGLVVLDARPSGDSVLCNCEDKIKQLEEEKQLLKQQLEVQLQVNCELKKLLVASVGDDLHHRVERLTRDRALLSMEVGDYSRKLSEDYEHLDKISIQADMWRSKFLASRVMTDELASAKAFYTMQYQECQVAMQQLLHERHELRANLFETYRGLHQIRGAFDPLNSDASSNQLTSKNVIDLARANQQLADAIKYRLLPSHVTASLANKIEPDWHDYLTKAEAHARELLAREVRPEDFRHLVPKSLAAPMGMSVDRFHPCTRFDHLTINVCCKCKGDISIV